MSVVSAAVKGSAILLMFGLTVRGHTFIFVKKNCFSICDIVKDIFGSNE